MYIYILVYVCMYINLYVGMHVCIYVCTYVLVYVCMYVCVCVYICMYDYMYLCMYVQYSQGWTNAAPIFQYHKHSTPQTVCCIETRLLHGVIFRNFAVRIFTDGNLIWSCIFAYNFIKCRIVHFVCVQNYIHAYTYIHTYIDTRTY
jgi:hypothetical protein